MAPTRKPRSMNKRFSSLNEVSPEKEGMNSNKNKQRKKKLSDKLGSQWNKDELERFYEAYRKYGKDWKKVAAAVRNRSVEMVEALYNMNRAYLSLPEGTASVVGLIAMMTDHYNVLEESDSEKESIDSPGSRKPVKRKRGKIELGASKDSVHTQSIASNDGCLSLLKRRRFDGSQPRAVGKRTPRVPVYYSYKKDERENYVSPNKRMLKSVFDANDDEVAHVAALALTEAAKRGGSPQVSQTPHRRSQQKFSPVQSWERMQQSGTVPAKFYDTSLDEEFMEGSIESRGAENGEQARDTSSLKDMEGSGTVEVNQKRKKVYRKKERKENVGNHLLDDGGEACSGTEEGLNFSLKEKVDVEVTNAKPQKRSKKLFFGADESSAVDALHALADLSLMIPASTMESESSVQLKEERTTVDKDEKPAVPEVTSTSQNRDKSKLSLKQKVVPSVRGVELSSSRKSKVGRTTINDKESKALFESKELLPTDDKTWKRKRKPMVPKLANAKHDSDPNDPLNDEAVDEEDKPLIKGKHTGQTSTPAKQKSVRSSESSLCADQKDLIVSTAEVQLVSLPTKRISKRKMSLPRTFIPKEKSSENKLKGQPNKYSSPPQDKASILKEKLSSCLSSSMIRRWCAFEWFYSAIDYPWFSKREFMEYLNHVGLGNIPRLTRVEWSVIKSSLGKPRRFSEHFLREERQKLEQYRQSVRKHYTELRTGIRDGLPTDLAKPLYVGQRVIALHPKTREIHDGSVLTVDHDKCRVQFDLPELGVEFVMDIDCMPLNPLDNMPEALRRQVGACKFPCISKEPQMDGISSFGGCLTCTSSNPVERAPNLAKQEKQAVGAQPCNMTDHQTKEANIHALSELTRFLDKKVSMGINEILLMELKNSNNAILENQIDSGSFKDSEALGKHYATVLVQLKEASEQVSNALLHLRQRNTYTGNSLPLKPQANLNVHDGLPGMLDGSLAQELGSTVIEIIKGSRVKAHAMVDAAFQALASVKEGEDAFLKIGQVLDSINYQQLAHNTSLPAMKSQEQGNGSLDNHTRSIFSSSEPLLNDVSGQKLRNDSDKVDAQIPSELITSCVAILIMIQTCTERQYPPSDVAQILDSAVTSLHPCCPQNLPIYREIQMCMGRIKTQILALIPTST
ncbi:protein ALWAYS EARLY 2 isoform X1 [Arachis ipaensis]|uniref:protein ALWAYS EARLY 2 isoform X1 n=1 Tax=Arachis ipaensis TaxID=130454 RepID=UPI0007AFDE18|nr:protein ALWAYS EARLY 2 isoform X1 [Arachis ipaensis]XP_016205528.1 protein ALWAYS EARLY 2 isoform X1 [Arachis ipaensis]XP_025662490.1 protein ALWAYS EARLY 2 isoform X1 [Arachis hypogaea]XP_025662491.1 protein ALWAYS EARLY 2 isoform X1 [Arachis hypogaea]XP_025662492.1 protein ALWAYS EARLY 2 isoform X1 [Arachis hypogaea]